MVGLKKCVKFDIENEWFNAKINDIQTDNG
jgi:hypothetical protein